MRKVEAQSIGRYERTLLLHMFAKHRAQCCVHQVSGRMIEANRLASLSIDMCFNFVTHSELTGLYRAVMHTGFAALLGIDNSE